MVAATRPKGCGRGKSGLHRAGCQITSGGGDSRDSATEYVEAKRLLKFLDYFLGVSSEEIPHNSLIREFIGGSCFKV